jgi:hypothetical protein
MRGTLEQIIDQVLIAIPLRKSSLQMGEAKGLHVKNEEDYLLGFAHGAIMGNFVAVFLGIMKRMPNDEEAKEVQTVAFNRTPQLREAIFKSG